MSDGKILRAFAGFGDLFCGVYFYFRSYKKDDKILVTDQKKYVENGICELEIMRL